jgi:hypothetical protein
MVIINHEGDVTHFGTLIEQWDPCTYQIQKPDGSYEVFRTNDPENTDPFGDELQLYAAYSLGDIA